MSQTPASKRSAAAKERSAKLAEAKSAAEATLGKKVKLIIAKPKKKVPAKPFVYHIKLSVNTKTGEVAVERKKAKPKKKKEESDASKPADSPDTA
jgi:hypothetical protein